MLVLTIDQRASRRRGDAVPALLAALDERAAAGPATHTPVLSFERTVGDEVQGVLADAGAAVDVALLVLRIGGWSIGIGAGPVDRPLGASTRSSSGPAFVRAREAVERARSRAVPVPLAVRGVEPVAAREAEAVLQLLGAVVVRRTPAGWAAIDALPGRTQREVAELLGVSPQAVSQRLRTAMWEEEEGVRPVVRRLLAAAEGARPAPATPASPESAG